jgi:hypothetical protein
MHDLCSSLGEEKEPDGVNHFLLVVRRLSLVMVGPGPGHVDDGKHDDNEHEKAKISTSKKIPQDRKEV